MRCGEAIGRHDAGPGGVEEEVDRHGEEDGGENGPRGILADVAPTVLHLLGVEQPNGMTGQSLIERVRMD